MKGDPIAYSFEADWHCPACTAERFGTEDGYPWPPESARDDEGSPIGALAPWDEWSQGNGCESLNCADCGGMIDVAHSAECRGGGLCDFDNG